MGWPLDLGGGRATLPRAGSRGREGGGGARAGGGDARLQPLRGGRPGVGAASYGPSAPAHAPQTCCLRRRGVLGWKRRRVTRAPRSRRRMLDVSTSARPGGRPCPLVKPAPGGRGGGVLRPVVSAGSQRRPGAAPTTAGVPVRPLPGLKLHSPRHSGQAQSGPPHARHVPYRLRWRRRSRRRAEPAAPPRRDRPLAFHIPPCAHAIREGCPVTRAQARSTPCPAAPGRLALLTGTGLCSGLRHLRDCAELLHQAQVGRGTGLLG